MTHDDAADLAKRWHKFASSRMTQKRCDTTLRLWESIWDHATKIHYYHITVEVVASWVNEQRAAGLSSSTIRAYLNCLRRMVKVLRGLEAGLTHATAFDEYMDLDSISAPYKPKAISWADATMLMDSTFKHGQDDLYRAMLLGFYGGLRMVEILAVRRKDFHAENGQFWLRVQGAKGGGQREVSVPSFVVNICVVLNSVATKGSDFVVRPDLQPRPRVYRWDFSPKFKQQVRATGLPDWVSPHTMRHTCAVAMLENGYSTEQAGAHLGHASITSTKVYADIRKLQPTVLLPA